MTHRRAGLLTAADIPRYGYRSSRATQWDAAAVRRMRRSEVGRIASVSARFILRRRGGQLHRSLHRPPMFQCSGGDSHGWAPVNYRVDRLICTQQPQCVKHEHCADRITDPRERRYSTTSCVRRGVIVRGRPQAKSMTLHKSWMDILGHIRIAIIWPSHPHSTRTDLSREPQGGQVALPSHRAAGPARSG